MPEPFRSQSGVNKPGPALLGGRCGGSCPADRGPDRSRARVRNAGRRPGRVRGAGRSRARVRGSGRRRVHRGRGHPTHVHDFHQFLHVPLGRIVVTALGRDHELSPSVALWIPAGIPHSARFDPDSLVVPENFDPELHHLPYSEVTSVNVSGAQRQLLLSRMRASEPAEEDPALFAALCSGHRDVLPLPRPTGRSAATVAGELMRNPGDPVRPPSGPRASTPARPACAGPSVPRPGSPSPSGGPGCASTTRSNCSPPGTW